MSSDDVVISARGVGKMYMIRPGERRQATLGETLMKWVRAPLSKARREEFWALKDVDFDVRAGECVGIIGRNGAGKSTLLKILSRITLPTAGRIEMTGRVGSLL